MEQLFGRQHSAAETHPGMVYYFFFSFWHLFLFDIYIFYIMVREPIVHALPQGEAHSLRRILFAWRVLWRMLWDHIQAAVESTLPWWRCQGVEALDNYEHFACYNVISHKQAVIVISHFLFSDIYAMCFFFFQSNEVQATLHGMCFCNLVVLSVLSSHSCNRHSKSAYMRKRHSSVLAQLLKEISSSTICTAWIGMEAHVSKCLVSRSALVNPWKHRSQKYKDVVLI